MVSLPPFVSRRGKILAVVNNFATSLVGVGLKEPVYNLKPTSTCVSSPSDILLPAKHTISLGAGLSAVIGKSGRDIAVGDAIQHVGGYTLTLDLLAKDRLLELIKLGHPFTAATAFDTFTPIGQLISKSDIADFSKASIKLSRSHVRAGADQSSVALRGSYSNASFSLPFVLAQISRVMSLEEGDLVYMGNAIEAGIVSEAGSIAVAVDGAPNLSPAVFNMLKA